MEHNSWRTQPFKFTVWILFVAFCVAKRKRGDPGFILKSLRDSLWVCQVYKLRPGNLCKTYTLRALQWITEPMQTWDVRGRAVVKLAYRRPAFRSPILRSQWILKTGTVALCVCGISVHKYAICGLRNHPVWENPMIPISQNHTYSAGQELVKSVSLLRRNFMVVERNSALSFHHVTLCYFSLCFVNGTSLTTLL